MLSLEQLRKVNVKRCEAVFHTLKSYSVPEWAMCAAGEM